MPAIGYSPDEAVVYLGGVVTDSLDMATKAGHVQALYVQDHELFLAAFDMQDGSALWAKVFGGVGTDQIFDLAVDPTSGEIVLTGYFEGSLSFDGGNTVLISAGLRDAFIAKLDSQGNHVWSKRYGDDDYQNGLAVAVDSKGGIATLFTGGGVVDFGDGPLVPNYGAIYIGKLDSAGSGQQSRFYEATTYVLPAADVAVDAADNIIVAASNNENMNGVPPSHTSELDAVVMKFDSGLTEKWTKMFGGATKEPVRQFSKAIAVDCAGDILVTGGFFGEMIFGDDTHQALGSGGPDIFLAKLSGQDGKPIWSHAFGDAGEHYGDSVSSDNLGNIVLGGFTRENDDSQGFGFGGMVFPKLGPLGPNDYKPDVFVAVFDPSGQHIWSNRYYDPFIQEGRVVVTPSGSVLIGGRHFQTLIFDKTPGGTLMPGNRTDFFAVRLMP